MTVTAAALAINVGSRPVQRRATVAATGLDAPAVSIAVTALRTAVDPNVEAGGDLARRIPVAGYVRFAARSTASNDPVRAAVSQCKLL